MNLLTQLWNSLTGFVSRHPLAALLIVLLAVGAPSVLVGVARFFLILIMTLLIVLVIAVLLFRYRIDTLRREMEREGGTSYTYTRTRRSARRTEGDVTVNRTSEEPGKRVKEDVGEYVEFEEVDEKR